MRKLCTLVLLLILCFAIVAISEIEIVKAQGTIYIRADGSVDPTIASIQQDDNVYTLTANLEERSIVIEASNIVFEGAGFTLGEIYRIDGDNVEIRNLKINAEVNAIQIYGSECKILNNEIKAKYIGIRIRDSDNNVISGNKIETEAAVGIGFETSNNNQVTDNSVNSKVWSVSLSHSDHNTFSRNNFGYVDLYHSSYNIFEECNLPQGIFIRSSSDYNQIIGNNITDFNKLADPYFGSSGSITLFSCADNVISSNTIINSGGIFLDTTLNSILRNNRVESAGTGFEVSDSTPPSLSSFINDIDDSNTINGKKIYYLTNKTDLTVNPLNYPNAGYLALVNCKRITVENMNLNTQGIMLAFTTDSQIKNNDVYNNSGEGVLLNSASNNKITKNEINKNSGVGVVFYYSTQNIVSSNNITGNQKGISFFSSSNNSITLNDIADQETGVHFYVSSNNLIYDNNFVNNTQQVYDVSWDVFDPNVPGAPPPSENIWDTGALIGGNCWSDYPTQYPDAEELDSSGMWDTPYIIDQNNQDNYPLMAPITTFDAGTWEWTNYHIKVISNSSVSNLSFIPDSKSIRFNVEGEIGTTGFCRVTVPKELLHVEDNWIVRVDGASVTPTIDEGVTNTYLHFTYNHSTKIIEIIGTYAIPEFPSWTPLLIAVVAVAAVVIIYRHTLCKQHQRERKL